MNRINRVLAISAIALSTSLVGCGASTSLTTEGVFVVGMECAYAPFNWTEPTKSDSNVAIEHVNDAYAEGYDVQVAALIAKELNLTLKVKAIAWEGLIPALNSGEIDAIIAGMSPTEARKQTIDFTDSYYTSTHVILLKSDSSFASATTLSDFSGARVIGQTGTLYADLVPQLVAKGAIAGTNLDTVPEIVGAISQGTVDVTILEEPVAQGIVSQFGDEFTYIKPTDGFEVNEEDVVVSICVRKNFDYTKRINNVLNNVLTKSKRDSLMQQAIALAPSGE